jgi:uncharacterized protein YkwD
MTDLRTRCQILSLSLALAAAWPAAADVIDAVNVVRDGGCAGRVARAAPLRENERLDEVARRLSQGSDLPTAEQAAGYHAASSFSVSISHVPPSGDIEGILTAKFCAQSTDAAFREIGTWRRGDSVWIALAQPFAPPAAAERVAISRRVLELTNRARAQARRCGATPFAPAPPLTLSTQLDRAAREYAQQMAAWGYMDHTGRDGTSPAQRITRSGYRWREVGENLASGQMSAADVVAGWLGSPEHCANLMDPLFRHMGVAYAVNRHDAAGVYWAQEFGAPR